MTSHRHGKRRRIQRVALNSVEIAINGARRLTADDALGYSALLKRAAREFAQGTDCARHWMTLADAANLAEALAELGIGSGADADDVIERAQLALAEVHARHAERGTWTMYADEPDALHWLERLHETQIAACSQSEFARAYDLVRNRVAGALAGNVARGSIVVGAACMERDVATQSNARSNQLQSAPESGRD